MKRQPLSPATMSDFVLLDAEPGQPIAPDVRRRMERSFGHDFGGVRLHVSALAGDLARRLGAQAFALGEHVGFAPGAYDRDTRYSLLAHELAHVVQQRLGCAAAGRAAVASRAALELEADLASEAALRGERFDCRLIDASGEPAAWGIIGHYYTPLLVFLNAQMDPQRAERLARWCWLPDQVSELDAATLGFSNYLFGLNDTTEGKTAALYSRYEKSGGRKFHDFRQYMHAVHTGIHVLTGGVASDEAKRRAQLFRDTRTHGLLFQAIALHSFGDCFAHRGFDNASSAFGRRIGPDSRHLYNWGLGHTTDLADPDHPWVKEHAGLYLDYVSQLCALANEYTGKGTMVTVDSLIVSLSAMLPVELRIYAGPTDTDNVKTVIGEIRKAKGRPADNAAQSSLGLDASPYVTWSKVDNRAKELAKRVVAESENSMADHIVQTAKSFGLGPLEKIREYDPVPWKQYWEREDNALWLGLDCVGPYAESRASSPSESDKVFFRILDHVLKFGNFGLHPVKGGEEIDDPLTVRVRQAPGYAKRSPQPTSGRRPTLEADGSYLLTEDEWSGLERSLTADGFRKIN